MLPGSLLAQDTLPKFSLINAGNNRVIIGWVNGLPNVKQISIQRSFDSLAGFTSILTVADPTTVQNGYLDAKAPNDHMFYRLFIMLDKGNYIFSKAKRPVKDSTQHLTTRDPDGKITDNRTPLQINIPDSARTGPVVLKLNGFPTVIDSINSPTSVTTKKKVDSFVPSLYVYTGRDGNVSIKLPDEEKPKKVTIKFFDQDDVFLFELKDLKEKEFKLDKANFFHAGWFHFEIYEDGKLLEKHKFYLEKDF